MTKWNVEYKLGKIKINSTDQDLMSEIADTLYGKALPVDPFVSGLGDDIFVSFYYNSDTSIEAIIKTTDLLNDTNVAEDFTLELIEEVKDECD